MAKRRNRLSDIDRSKRRSIWTLFTFTMFVPELISGSTPPIGFNAILIFMFVWAYSVPMLLIRDLAVRFKIGTAGIICFGLAYGIVNEGLFAKTILWDHDLPIQQYDHLGRFLGINFGWAAIICSWHAFASTLFPIVFTELSNLKTAEEPWLKPDWFWVLFALDLAVGCACFLHFTIKGSAGTFPMLLLLLGLMAALFALGFYLKGSRATAVGKLAPKTIALGFSVCIPFITLIVFAAAHVNFWVFLGLLTGVFLLYKKWLGAKGLERKGLASFALGFYLYCGAFAGIAWFVKSPMVAAISIPINAAIIVVLWSLLRRSAKDTFPEGNVISTLSSPAL